MKKKILVFLTVLALCASFTFAGTDMKVLEFGPHKYTISELAPDFSTWDFRLIGKTTVSTDHLCDVVLVESLNPDRTVLVKILLVGERKEIYIAGIIVMYIPKGKDPYGECYEDLRYFRGGQPSFVLTKVDKPSDVDKLIQMKKMQFGKKVAT